MIELKRKGEPTCRFQDNHLLKAGACLREMVGRGQRGQRVQVFQDGTQKIAHIRISRGGKPRLVLYDLYELSEAK